MEDSKFVANALSVIQFFNQLGFCQSDTRQLIRRCPQYLFSSSDKSLKPKIELLSQVGIVGSDLVHVVSRNPSILGYQCLGSAIHGLRIVLGTDDNVVSLLKRPFLINFRAVADNLILNVGLLQTCYGIPIDNVRTFVIREPSLFTTRSDLFRDILFNVEHKLGIPRDSAMFLSGFQLLSCYKENKLEDKCAVFKSFGWTQSDVMMLIRQNPMCLSSSKARIKERLRFLMNQLGYKPNYLASQPALFTCSLEKRLLPRHRVLQVLKEKGLCKKDYSIATIAPLSESKFLERFVLPFEQVHQVFEQLTVCNNNDNNNNNNNNFTCTLAKFLVESLGFSKKQSLTTSAKLAKWQLADDLKAIDSKIVDNARSVIQFFKKLGFSQSDTLQLIRRYPQYLFYRVDKTLKPRIQLLLELGVSESDLVHVLLKNPSLLSYQCLGSAIHALKIVLGTDGNVVSLLKRCIFANLRGVADNLIPNVEFLQTCYGISTDNVQRFVMWYPSMFIVRSELFTDVLIKVEHKLGISRRSAMFLYGFQLLSFYKENNLEDKYAVFKSFGWSQSNVMKLIRKNPRCLSSSEGRIKERLGFLMKQLGYEPQYLAKQSALFSCSLEKRLLPRHRVLQVLKKKGLCKKDSIVTIAPLSESKFLERFVLPFEQVHQVYEKLTGCKVGTHAAEIAKGKSKK